MSDKLAQALKAHLLAVDNKFSSCPELSDRDKNVLRSLTTYAPGIPQRIDMCREITDCSDASALNALAELVVILITKCKRSSGFSNIVFLAHVTGVLVAGTQPPEVSDQPSSPLFDEAADVLTMQSESSHSQQRVTESTVSPAV